MAERAYLVARSSPGTNHRNTLALSIFRAVIYTPPDTVGSSDERVLVLETEDGSFREEILFRDAERKEDSLIFDFHVGDRQKKHRCYIRGDAGSIPVEGPLPQFMIEV